MQHPAARMPNNAGNFAQQQNVLSLDEQEDVDAALPSARRGPNKLEAPPELGDSKYQKQFALSFEDFESRLVLATVLSLVSVAAGILGRYCTRSPTLLSLSLVCLFLNGDWLIGFMLSNKVKKELGRIHFRNLNGGAAFELLMAYCQMQIVAIAGLFIYALHCGARVLAEMRELETLAAGGDGALWESQFSLTSVAAVEVQLGAFFLVQAVLLLAIKGVLVGFVKSGLRWGDHQAQSRAKGYFTAVACVVIPFVALSLVDAAKRDHEFLSELPAMGNYLSHPYQLYACYAIAGLMTLLACFAYIGAVCNSPAMIQKYIPLQFTALAATAGLALLITVNISRFSLLSWIGRQSTYDAMWPSIMKQVAMTEFDQGITGCPGGKYLQDTPLSTNFYEVECPEVEDFDRSGIVQQDYIALLWELQRGGVIAQDEVMFGCLNPECAPYLEKGVIAHQFVMLGCMLKLVLLSLFSVGLAAHTLRFDVHYKSVGHEAGSLLLMIIVVGAGLTLNYLSTDKVLDTNPESQWSQDPDSLLPQMRENFQTNNSPWYPLTQAFRVEESCAGVADESCAELSYRVSLQATTGQLRFSNEERTTVRTELTAEGSVDEVNALLAMTQFMPACDDASPGILNLVVSAYAWGPSASAQTAAKMAPEGVFQRVSGTNEQRFYFASHQESVFRRGEQIPLYGRVQDMSGSVLPD